MKLINKNTKWNLLGAVFPVLAGLVVIPYLLEMLGNEGFGLLTLIWALIGYFSLFDFGMGRALTYELSGKSKNDKDEISKIIKAGILLTAITGLLGTVLVLLSTEYIVGKLKIDHEWVDDAVKAFSWAALGIVATSINNGFKGMLEGLDEFKSSNINKIVTGSIMFLAPAVSVYVHGVQVWISAIYMVITRLIVTIIYYYKIKKYLDKKKATLVDVKILLTYGGWVSITGLIGPLMVYGDRFFVGSLVGADALPFYAIPQEGLQRLLLIPSAICGALLPLLVTAPRYNLIDQYIKLLKKLSILMAPICGLAVILAFPLLKIWISLEFARSSLPIIIILGLGILLNSMALVPYTAMHAIGKPKITAIFHIIELIIYVLLIIVLTENYGLVGAALAWTMRVAIDLIFLHAAVMFYVKKVPSSD